MPHLHREFEESFFVFAGRFTFTVGQEGIVADPGTYILVPRGTAHTITAAEGGGRFLTLMVPGGLEEMFFDPRRTATERDPRPGRPQSDLCTLRLNPRLTLLLDPGSHDVGRWALPQHHRVPSSRSPVNRLVPSWAKDPKIGNSDDQCTHGHGAREAGVQAGVQVAAAVGAGGRVL